MKKRKKLTSKNMASVCEDLREQQRQLLQMADRDNLQSEACVKYPHCEFARSPLGTIRANIDEDGHKWRIAIYEDFGQYGNRFSTYPIPGLRTAELYSVLYRQKFKK